MAYEIDLLRAEKTALAAEMTMRVAEFATCDAEHTAPRVDPTIRAA